MRMRRGEERMLLDGENHVILVKKSGGSYFILETEKRRKRGSVSLEKV